MLMGSESVWHTWWYHDLWNGVGLINGLECHQRCFMSTKIKPLVWRQYFVSPYESLGKGWSMARYAKRAWLVDWSMLSILTIIYKETILAWSEKFVMSMTFLICHRWNLCWQGSLIWFMVASSRHLFIWFCFFCRRYWWFYSHLLLLCNWGLILTVRGSEIASHGMSGGWLTLRHSFCQLLCLDPYMALLVSRQSCIVQRQLKMKSAISATSKTKDRKQVCINLSSCLQAINDS